MDTTVEYSEEFLVYHRALRLAKLRELSRKEAKEYAKNKLYEVYPKFAEYGKYPKFWSMVSTLVDDVYPETKLVTESTPAVETSGKKTFSFIEFYQYLADNLHRLPDDKMGNKIGEFFGFSDSIAGSTRAGLVSKGYKLTVRSDGGWDVELPAHMEILEDTKAKIYRMFGNELTDNQQEAISLLISVSLANRAASSGA